MDNENINDSNNQLMTGGNVLTLDIFYRQMERIYDKLDSNEGKSEKRFQKIENDIVELRKDMNYEISGLRKELHTEVASLKEDVSGLKTSVAEISGKLKTMPNILTTIAILITFSVSVFGMMLVIK